MKANKHTRVHAKTDLARKTANEKERRIKRQIGEVGEMKTRGKWWSGGEENRRQMANNVSAERWDLWLEPGECWRSLPGNGARNTSWWLWWWWCFALWFPEAERMMQQAEKYFPQLRTKVSNQKEVLAPPRVQPLHTRKQISAPNANKGLSSPCR